MPLHRLFTRLARAADARTFSPTAPLLHALWMTGVRLLEEKAFIWDARTWRSDDYSVVITSFGFYIALVYCVGAIVTHVASIDWRRAMNAATLGITVAVLPPLIDVFIYGRGNFAYHNQGGGIAGTNLLFFNWSSDLPAGEGITIWLSVLLVAAYVHHACKSIARTLVAGLLQYLLGVAFLFLVPPVAKALVALPGGNQIADNWALGWTWMGIAFLAYAVLRHELAVEALRRLPQILLAPALAFLGASFAGRINALTLVAVAAMLAMGAVFAMANLDYDREADTRGGRTTRVTRDDTVFLYGWAMVLLVMLGRGYPYLALLCGLFLITAHGYHADPLRAKCTFPLSYKAEGLLAGCAFAAGILVHPKYTLSVPEIWATLLVAAGLSLAAPFKDVKDVDADRAAGVRTLYVVLHDRGWRLETVHRLAQLLLSVSLIVPLLYLHTLGTTGPSALGASGLGLVAVAATFDRQRRRGVALAVTAVVAYLVVVALALSARGG